MTFDFFGYRFEFFSSERQIEKFHYYVSQYILNYPVVTAIIITIIFLNVYRIFKDKWSDKTLHLINNCLPFYYIYLIACFFVFNRPIESYRKMNLGFDKLTWGGSNIHETMVLTFIINIIFFIPMGILVYKYWQHTFINFLFVVVLCLLIEELQYFFYRGTASFADLIAYLFGVGIGILIMKIKEKRVKDD